MANPLDSEVADKADKKTETVRQGTGPRATVSVLLVSLTLAIVAGVVVFMLFMS